MIDLKDRVERARLLKAIKTSREALEPFRKVRTELIRDYVGSWYSTKGARFETYVNLLHQTAEIYTIALAANNPRVKVTTKKPELWPFARRFEIGINRLIADMQLDQTLRLIILDAFFSIGVAKVCMADRGQVEIEQDVWYDPGQPWVERVSVDDLILDLTAKELSKMRFAGDRFRVPWRKVREEPTYDQAVVRRLSPTSRHGHGDSEERARDISAGNEVDDDELEPMVWLMNVWLPENGTVATFACDEDLPPLIERPWTGAQGGPYKYLTLGHVPDNVFPSSPASNLKGLHDLYNRIYRKMAAQSSRQKQVNVFPYGEDKDANSLRKAKDGDWVPVRDPRQIQTVVFGGVDSANNAFALAVMDLFDRMAGNLRAMGGLGAQAETLGQEEIIQGNVSRKEAKMQAEVVQFAAEICWDLGKLMWDDAFLEIPAAIEIPKTGVYLDATWRPDDRLGDFNAYDFQVEPYSMVYQPPAQKVQRISQVLQQIAPLWPMFQASGATLDVEELVHLFSDYLDLPEIERIITFAMPAMQLGGDQNTIRQSPITQRETIRRNIPTGGTADNRSAILQQVLMGGGQTTPQQRASLTRPTA